MKIQTTVVTRSGERVVMDGEAESLDAARQRLEEFMRSPEDLMAFLESPHQAAIIPTRAVDIVYLVDIDNQPF